MKRVLSVLLAMCMVAMLMPVLPMQTAFALENPATYTYKLGQANDVGGLVAVPTVTEYVAKGGTNGKWKYYGMDSSLAELQAGNSRQVEINQSYGAYMSIGFTTVGQYVQLMVKLPNTDSYFTPTVNCTSGGNSTNVNMYIAPKGAADPMADEYFVGGFDPRNASTTLNTFATDSEATEYIITFEDATAGNGHNARILNLVFTETEKPEIKLDSEYTYKLGQANDVGGLVVVPTVTDYVAKGGTNGEWKYYGMCDGLLVIQEANNRTFEINQSYGAFMSISFNAVGQYAELMIKIPKKNAYFVPELTLYTGANSTKAKVYIAPKSAENPRAKEYLRGYFSAKDMTCELSGFMTDANETEYILTFENVSTGNGNDIRVQSLVLSETDVAEVQSVDEEYAFNFVHATADVGIPTLDTYEKTLRNWKYCNMESTLKATYDAGGTSARTLAGCLNIVPRNANGQWLSLTLDNLSNGTYDIEFSYTTHKNGGIGDIYLAPASVSESARMNAEYKIGTIDYYEAGAAYETVYTAKLLKTTLKEDGDYVITFKHTGKKNPSATGYQMNPVKLRLCETDADAPAGEVTETFASLSVLAENGGTVSVEGSYDVVDSVPVGTKIKATATANEGYAFAYWRNAAGAHLSSNVEETFTVNTNTAVIAVFDKIPSESDVEVPVYFYNGNGNLLESKKVAKETTFAEIKISNPTLTGYVFDKWSIDDNAVINTLTRAVALFEDSDKTYTVEVNGEAVKTDAVYGESVTVTSDNNNFSYWKVGNQIISYEKSFAFNVYGNIALASVCEGAMRAEPTVVLDIVDGENFLSYNVPEGFVKIEAGILFSKGEKPEVGSFFSKASEKTGSGQFTAKSSGEGETVARGYLIFKNPDGDIRVMYTD